ncbi:hypothetical protein [Streptomyces malaysiensis]|uniref:hypothetical protein n=1 Tax=Streptomyces malaysiensis TaxID=92644 RepID=UPI0033F4477A
MSTAHDHPVGPSSSESAHPLRTIRDIREALPADQVAHFDAELAVTDLDDLPAMLTRWATTAHDGFVDFLQQAPFEDLEFGTRSYDEAQGPE